MAQQKKQITSSNETRNTHYLKAFINQPTLDNFHNLQRLRSPVVVSPTFLAWKLPAISAVIRSFRMLNDKPPSTKLAIELLSEHLVHTNLYIWSALGFAFMKGGSLADIKPEHRHHFLAESSNSRELAAFCHSKMLLIPNLPSNLKSDAWCNLAISFFKNGGSFNDLPGAIKKLFPENSASFDFTYLKTFCYYRALEHNDKNGVAWRELGQSLFLLGIAGFAYFPKDIKDKFPEGSENFNSETLQAFCFGKALSLNDKDHEAWRLFGLLFSGQKSPFFASLPQEIRNKFPAGSGRPNRAALSFFCVGRAMIFDDYDSWNALSLGMTKESFDILPQELRNKFPAGSESQSTATLKAFCLGKSIILGNRNRRTLLSFADSFAKGASFAVLPSRIKGLFPQGSETQSCAVHAAVCYSKVLILNDKETAAWKGLGDVLLQGALFDRLPRRIKNMFPAGCDHQNPSILAGFCMSKALMLDNNYPSAWHSLSEAFFQGLQFATLPEEIRKLLPAVSETQEFPTLSIWCLNNALKLYDKHGLSWKSLGYFLSDGVVFAGLPQELKAKFPEGSESKSLNSLITFCYSKAVLYSPQALTWWELAICLENGPSHAEVCPELRTVLLRYTDNNNSVPENLEFANLCLREARRMDNDDNLKLQADIDRLAEKLKPYQNRKRSLEVDEQDHPPEKRARTENSNTAGQFWSQQPVSEKNDVEEIMAIEPTALEQLANLAVIKEEPQEDCFGFGNGH